MKTVIDRLGKVSITVEKDYWDINRDYDRLVIVERDGEGAYLSRKPVPAGTLITDRNFWIRVSFKFGIPGLAQNFGHDDSVGISQKTITERIEEILKPSDWEEQDENASTFIKNKPDLTVYETKEDAARLSRKVDTKQDIIEDLDEIREGAEKGASAVQPGNSLEHYGILNAYTKEETYTKQQVNERVTTPHENYVTVATKAELDAIQNPQADTIYRVAQYDFTANDGAGAVDVTKYSEYALAGTEMVPLAVKTNIDEPFDISLYHSGATYANLTDALGVDGANVPEGQRNGGMQVKFKTGTEANYTIAVTTTDEEPTGTELQSDILNAFVDGTYVGSQLANTVLLPSNVGDSLVYYIMTEEDEVVTYKVWTITKISSAVGKYNQYRLLSGEWSTNVDDWQNIDTDEIYASMGFYTCDSLSISPAKVISSPKYKLTVGGSIKIKMLAKNTARSTVTLQIGSEEAKPLYYNGMAVNESNTWDANEVIEVCYDGTNYYSYNTLGSYVTPKRVVVTDTEASILPNILYVFGSCSNLNLTLITPPNASTSLTEYMFEFTVNANTFALTLPTGIKWIDDEMPDFELGYTYQVSIVDTLAISAGWSNDSQ